MRNSTLSSTCCAEDSCSCPSSSKTLNSARSSTMTENSCVSLCSCSENNDNRNSTAGHRESSIYSEQHSYCSCNTKVCYDPAPKSSAHKPAAAYQNDTSSTKLNQFRSGNASYSNPSINGRSSDAENVYSSPVEETIDSANKIQKRRLPPIPANQNNLSPPNYANINIARNTVPPETTNSSSHWTPPHLSSFVRSNVTFTPDEQAARKTANVPMETAM